MHAHQSWPHVAATVHVFIVVLARLVAHIIHYIVQITSASLLCLQLVACISKSIDFRGTKIHAFS